MKAFNKELTAGDQFLKCHDKLRQQLNIANWSFTVYKYFASISKDYMDEIDQAFSFFDLTVNAHIISTIIRLNTFFDKRQQHLSIRWLLNFIEKNLDVFSKQAFEKRLRDKGTYDSHWIETHNEVTVEIVEKHRKMVNDLPISALRRWRREIIAHINADTVLGKNEIGKNLLQTKHVETVIDTLHDILNYYLLAFDCSSFSKDLSVEHEMQYILDAIRSDLQMRGSMRKR